MHHQRIQLPHCPLEDYAFTAGDGSRENPFR